MTELFSAICGKKEKKKKTIKIDKNRNIEHTDFCKNKTYCFIHTLAQILLKLKK